jgi:hypothetical protein
MLRVTPTPEDTMSKKTTAELSKGKTPVALKPLKKNAYLEGKLSIQNDPDSKPWINQRLPDHDKSQREKGRH